MGDSCLQYDLVHADFVETVFVRPIALGDETSGTAWLDAFDIAHYTSGGLTTRLTYFGARPRRYF